MNPTLFSEISNRETWLRIIQIADGDTGELISFVDDDGNPVYDFKLEITPTQPRGHSGGGYGPWYDDGCAPMISASTADYISIVDTGTIQIEIPKSVIQSLNSPRTYDVFLNINVIDEDDGRTLLLGRLPVLYGGRNT